jgi:SAM-dependent methyltransferase
MPTNDAFADLARYYDRLMDHVDYDRWYIAATTLAGLLPGPIVHLDAACGTGVLLKKLVRLGWNSVGIDLSQAMLRNGKKAPGAMPAAAADLRALPFSESLDYITCLFDSINFLLDPGDMRRAIGEFARALKPGGLLYFDIVTERMVLEHFAGQSWTEDNGGFSTTWESDYVRKTGQSHTHIKVGSGARSTITERVYEQDEIEDAVAAAGLDLLGAFDAESWRAPGKKSIRIEFVAVKGNPKFHRRDFQTACADIKGFLS